MGVYSDYLDRGFDFQGLTNERKAQLKRISDLRGRDVLVYAADLKEDARLVMILPPDVLPVTDQLANLRGDKLDLILETPGGSGETAEQIMRMIRDKYDDVAIIVPGTAKSAGTIMAMGADEILMEPFASALGPIDVQLPSYSAEALIKGVERIKKEVDKTGQLNKAYVPILNRVSPGDLEHARNGLGFAKDLVSDWLAQYKFRTWTTHRTSGKPTFGTPVTTRQKKVRARQIANRLANHGYWKTHGRSISISDLHEMRLEVADYSADPDLAGAIRRYFTLLQMTFESNIYKVFETTRTQIVRFKAPPPPIQQPAQQGPPDSILGEIECGKCKKKQKIQADLKPGIPLQQECIRFPADNKYKCPECSTEQDLTMLRQQIEAQTKKKVVP